MNEFRFICARLILDKRVLKILSVTECHTYHFSDPIALSLITLPRFLQREGKVKMKTMHKKKTLNVACLVSLFFIDQFSKMFIAGRKCYSFKMQVLHVH